MTTKPEALQLAEVFEDELKWNTTPISRTETAAELRRLHEVNQELLDVLKAFSDYVRDEQNSTDGAVTYSTTAINHWAFLARATINKATGEQA